MGKPAARLGDMHVCPMITPALIPIPHVGGPIMSPGYPMVMIGGMAASVVGDICICVGPPDAVMVGSTGIMIGGKPAARAGDLTLHGGSIVGGLPTVMIGEKLTPFQLSRMDAIDQALLDQRAMLLAKLAELEKWDEAAKANARKFLGSDSEATRQMLMDRIKKELELNSKTSIGNFQPIPDSDPKKATTYAYVHPGDDSHTIYLGGKFDSAPPTGQDSKAGTLSHEMSHFNDVGGTDDVVYGQKGAENLAKTNPAKAQKNADNFEYYLEN